MTECILQPTPGTVQKGVVRLSYCSVEKHRLTPEQFDDLGRLCSVRNALLRVSGILVYLEGGIFFSVLEGKASVVQDLYVKITHDIRHHDCFIINLERDVKHELYPSFSHRQVFSRGSVEVYSIVTNVLQTMSTTYSILGRYMQPAILHQLQQGQHPFESDPCIVQATVCFIGVHNLGSSSWLTHDKYTDYISTLSQLYEHVTKTVIRSGGEVVKFIGESILAVFPSTLTPNALHCAFNLVALVGTMISKSSLQSAKVGIGMCAGNVIQGNVGSVSSADNKLDYTLLGGVVNMASRVKGLTKAGPNILVDDNVKRLAGPHWVFMSHGMRPLKGIQNKKETHSPSPKDLMGSSENVRLLPNSLLMREGEAQQGVDMLMSSYNSSSVDQTVSRVSELVYNALENATMQEEEDLDNSKPCALSSSLRPVEQESTAYDTSSATESSDDAVLSKPASGTSVPGVVRRLFTKSSPQPQSVASVRRTVTPPGHRRRKSLTTWGEPSRFELPKTEVRRSSLSEAPLSITRVTFVSLAKDLITDSEWEVLVAKWTAKNVEQDITGRLLRSSSGELYLQVLEGTHRAISKLLDTIMGDTRHRHVTRCGTVKLSREQRMYQTFSAATFRFATDEAANSEDEDDQHQETQEEDVVMPMIRLVVDTMLTSFVALQRYTQPKVLSILQSGADPRRYYSHLLNANVLVTDIVNFTMISERVDLNGIVAFTNTFLDVCIGMVERAGGQVNKLVGDCVVAYFPAAASGAALAASLDIQRALADERRLAPPGSINELLYCGIGLAYGRVFEGNVGVTRLDFALIGEAVEAGYAIEGDTRSTDHSILMTREFRENLLAMSAEHALAPGSPPLPDPSAHVQVDEALGYYSVDYPEALWGLDDINTYAPRFFDANIERFHGSPTVTASPCSMGWLSPPANKVMSSLSSPRSPGDDGAINLDDLMEDAIFEDLSEDATPTPRGSTSLRAVLQSLDVNTPSQRERRVFYDAEYASLREQRTAVGNKEDSLVQTSSKGFLALAFNSINSTPETKQLCASHGSPSRAASSVTSPLSAKLGCPSPLDVRPEFRSLQAPLRLQTTRSETLKSVAARFNKLNESPPGRRVFSLPHNHLASALSRMQQHAADVPPSPLSDLAALPEEEEQLATCPEDTRFIHASSSVDNTSRNSDVSVPNLPDG